MTLSSHLSPVHDKGIVLLVAGGLLAAGLPRDRKDPGQVGSKNFVPTPPQQRSTLLVSVVIRMRRMG